MKYLVSRYTRLMWAVCSGEVGVGVGTRSRMCHRGWVGWGGYMGTQLSYVMSKLIHLGLWYHTRCAVERNVHICLSYTYAMCNIIKNAVSIVIVFRFLHLFWLLLYLLYSKSV